jgi:hypothetical protein
MERRASEIAPELAAGSRQPTDRSLSDPLARDTHSRRRPDEFWRGRQSQNVTGHGWFMAHHDGA